MIPIHAISEVEKKEIKFLELPPLKSQVISEFHRHDFFECFVFLKGGGTHLIDFEEFPIQVHSIHIITPGQVHQLKRAANSQGYVIMFDLPIFDNSKLIENLLFDHACFDVSEFSPCYQFDDTTQSMLELTLKQFVLLNTTESKIKQHYFLNLLSSLFLYCIDENSKLYQQSNTTQNQTYSNFRKLLKSNFKVLKKVKEYSVQLKITEKTLNELVQQKTGENVSSLIYNQLILEAKRLLNSGVSTKEVAYELNFNDPAHFSKFFKSRTGISPSEFKKIHV